MQKDSLRSINKRIRQAGSVFTVLLAGIAMASALSLVLYQTISGPMSSMVRITNKNSAKMQLQSVASIVIMDAINGAAGGDCDGDGSVEPREWRATAGAKPTNGGLIPLTIGAPTTDPWGTDYGYCVWDVGSNIKTGCPGGAGALRLSGTPTPTTGTDLASTKTVIAVISAGPNRQFQTTCNNYVNGTTDVITTTGDDIVQRYTYAEAASATSSLWTLKPADSTKAIISKDLEIGPSAAVTVGATTGLISATAITTLGKITSGGAIQLADQTAVTSCVAANYGDLRYNKTTNTIESCNGAGTWTAAGGGGASATAFSFIDQTGVALNSTITSNTVTLAGITGTVSAVCNAGCTAIARNGIWGGTTSSFANGDTIAIRQTSSGTPGAATTATVSVGTTTSGIWTVTTTSNAPASFSFTDQTGVATGAVVSSNAVTLTGTFSGLTATCGAGCIAIARNGTWGSTTVAGFNTGDTIAIRQSASLNASTATTATVTVGPTTSGTWTVTTTTDACSAASPAAGTVCADGSVYAGLTPDGNNKMYVTPCDAGQALSGGVCSGTLLTKKWAYNGTIELGTSSNSLGKNNTATEYAANANADGPYDAATYCKTLSAYGHIDWYLPAAGELAAIYNNKTAIGGYSTNIYWSSTEPSGMGGYRATSVSFNDGTSANPAKTALYYLRCARTGSGSPAAITFTNQSGVNLNATISSAAVTLSGSFVNLTATCNTGCTAIAKNGVWGGTTLTNFNPGDTIAIRQTSSGSLATATTASVTVGSTASAVWTVTTTATDPCDAASPAAGTLCVDGSLYVGLSPDGNIKMFTTPCDAGMTLSGGVCTGTRLGKTWNNGSANWTTTGLTSLNGGKYNTQALVSSTDAGSTYAAADYCKSLSAHGHTDWYLPALYELNLLCTNKVAIGGFDTFNYSAYSSSTENTSSTPWRQMFIDGLNCAYYDGGYFSETKASSTNLLRCVRVPAGTGVVNAFSFTDQAGAGLNSGIASNAVTLGGGFANMVASCSGACISISRNGGAWSTSPMLGGFNSGDTISIKMLSSGSLNTAVTGSVTVGSTVSGTWSVTTTTTDPCAAGSPTIGATCSDGTVYAGLSPDTNVKMYVTPCDAGQSMSNGVCTGTRLQKSWNNGSYSWVVTGYTSNITGRANTTGLAARSDGANPYFAANYCDSLVANGNSDWYLPAITELHLISGNKTSIGNFDLTGKWYWSSTEGSGDQAGNERTSDSISGWNYKDGGNYYVRCARR